jgi:hypothetical protein
MVCPCVQCQGKVHRSKRGVHEHLNLYGRDPLQRICYDGNGNDSSDDEWAADWLSRMDSFDNDFMDNSGEKDGQHEEGAHTHDIQEDELDIGEGINIPQMLNGIFANVEQMRSRFDSEHEEEAATSNATNFDESEDTEDCTNFPERVRSACTALYDGASISELGFLVMFFNICTCHNVANVCATELLSFLKTSVLPKNNKVPKNMYEARKVISSMGLDYKEIGACKKGCVLFRNEFADLQECPKCYEPRYIQRGQSQRPSKVLQYFPLIPRLQRMFGSPVLSEMMTWTATNKSTDGKQRHIGDSAHWKWIDERWPEFAGEQRNVRLGLSLDGMNPFGDKNNVYSCWPVTILNYNIPPWQTIKKFFIMMVLLIPGPESALMENIDVWLAPVLEELKQL